ncbi:PLP-dependent aminotransferase family protein [Lentibacillus sp. L22]|uniref:MocR-like transcriptional regulator GabR n=1 Tax=Lentibacillus TaxID=175304 RepID=UPI0022B1DB34|nr:PLP-dependent aminotransferase family protein [Lentibacillus daqui]
MLFTLDKMECRKNLYQQIYERLKEHMMNGRLQANEKLPSKRQLAEQLQVSVNTVTNAYEQLLAEGYIYTKERKGYYVENITPFIQRGSLQKLPKDLKECTQNKEGWLSLSHMTSDISMFPVQEWMKCQQKAIANHKRELSELGHFQGPYMVRQTIARMIAMSRGVVCEPEQIVIGAGTQLLIRNLMGLSKRDSVVAVEDPGYSRFYTLLKNMGFDVRALPIDDKGIAMDEVDDCSINYLFVTPSHQFPTGKIMPINRRIELLNWSTQGQDRYIIEDDYDSEFKYETDSIPSLQSLDQNQRIIYTGTFSKTILPGLRISYMVLPPDMLRKYRKHYRHLMQSSNALSLYTLYYFIETGAYARHLKRMTHHYESKRKELMGQIRERFGEKVAIEDIPAGLHFLARFQTKKSYEEVEEDAKRKKLEIYSMRRFMLANKYQTPGVVDLVLGFANIQEEQIPEAVKRLERVLLG